ncbi:cytochrome ubiquinol oxidase subunit I, partial [Salmonella enterica subsp. enterica serovar Muenster]
KVAQAATNADGLALVFIAFAILYLVLGISSSYVLIRMFSHSKATDDVNKIIDRKGEV